MSDQQSIKIGVTADTAPATAGMNKLSDATRNANQHLEKLVAALTKVSGRAVDDVTAIMAADRFTKLRRISSGLRGYSDLGDFLEGPGAALHGSTPQGHAYRQRVIGALIGDAAAAAERGAGWRVTHAAGGGAGDRGGGFGNGLMTGLLKNMGGLGKIALGGGAFAAGTMGAEAIVGLARKYVTNVANEASAMDSLKRRTGDLGMSFSGLMAQTHKAADGLGVTYAESAKLADALTRVAGNFQGGDLRAALGFARATGMGIGGSVDFFGTMRRVGDIGSRDGEMKRFAYLVGQAVASSGYSGQVEAITRAVAQYATTSARFGLSTPNIGGYLGALTGLTSTGIPGLDPEGAAALLGRADSTIRTGGGGQWGMAFLMQALGAGGDPYATRALWQQGIFGSSSGAFSGPWASMVRRFGGRAPGGSGATNFATIKAAFDRAFAGTGSAGPAAFAQLFGLSSDAQGAALHEMSPRAFNILQNTLQRYGIKMSDVSATGMIDFGAVSRASGISGLLAVRNKLLGRGGLSSSDRGYLSGLNGSMSEDALRQALGKFALTREQEDTTASILRRWATDTENTFAGLGDRLLNPLNGILTGINKLAGIDHILGSGFMSSGNAPALGLPAGIMAGPAGFKLFAAALGHAESGGNPLAKNRNSSALGLFQFTAGTWAKYGAGLDIRNPNAQRIALYREMQDAEAQGASTVQDLVNFHHYGPGGWRGHGADAEVRSVEHYINVNITNNGRTVTTTRLPLNAGAPITPAGGGTLSAVAPY